MARASGMSKSVGQIVSTYKDEIRKLPAASVSWAWDDVVARGDDAGGDVDPSVVTRLRDNDHIVRSSEPGEWTVTRRFEEYVESRHAIELDAARPLGEGQTSPPIDTSPSRQYVASPSPSDSVRQVALDGDAPDRDDARRRRWQDLEAERDDDQLTLIESTPDRVTGTRLARKAGGTYPSPPVA